MKESYCVDLANRTILESCGNHSNVMAEALTEGSTGGLLSFEIGRQSGHSYTPDMIGGAVVLFQIIPTRPLGLRRDKMARQA